MWVYIVPIKDGVENFEVGFYTPTGDWVVITKYATEAAAAKRVHYLNGGNWEGREEDT